VRLEGREEREGWKEKEGMETRDKESREGVNRWMKKGKVQM